MTRFLRFVPRLLKETALTVGAIGGLAFAIFAICAVSLGLRPLVVQSGSMGPAIGTGSLLVTQKTPAADLRKGDVVTVRRFDHTLVTHRIVATTLRGDTATLKLKGDANDVADLEAYQVKQAGRKVFVVPYAGYVAAWAASPLGLFLLGLYVAFLVAVVVGDVRGRRGRGERRDGGDRGSPDRPDRPARGGKRKASKRIASVAGAVALTLGVAGVPVVSPQPTLAAWTDDATAGTSTLTAYTVPKPVWVSCNVTGGLLSLKTATIVWQEVSSPYALDYTATIQETGASMTVTDNGATRQTQFSAGLLSTILNQAYHIVIQAKLPSPNGSWVSATMTQQVTITLLGVGMTCDSHD